MLLLHWTLVFLVLALIAGALGFSGVAKESAGIAKIRLLFVIFLIIYIAAFIFSNMQ